MNLALATAARVLHQLRHDHRTVALLLVLPCLLLGLMAWMYVDTPQVFDRLGPALLGIFPLTVMFVVTSIATLRERQSGTLERLLTTPLSKGAFMGGYGLAFGVMALVQAVVVSAWAIWVCGLDIVGSWGLMIAVAVANAVLGTSMGLLASGFARTEFQAVQFMPAFIFPQFLLCGLILPRDRLPVGLKDLSDVLPLSYAVEAMQLVASTVENSQVWRDLAILIAFSVLSLVLGSLTLRRRTP